MNLSDVKEIKTVSKAYRSEFDDEVNEALKSGWVFLHAPKVIALNDRSYNTRYFVTMTRSKGDEL